MSIVTLTTDFGLADSYVAIMKGVLLSINPALDIVDITHDIEPQDVAQAGFVLANATRYFPEKAIHVCVVDPGVGGGRRPIAFTAGGRTCVGPDNGLFTQILGVHEPVTLYEITNKDYMLSQVSHTFHGRDIFAPVAGWLSKGAPISSVGPAIDDPLLLNLPREARTAPNIIKGEVIHIDRFGNAITNISMNLCEQALADTSAQLVEVRSEHGVAKNILPSYASARGGVLSAIYGSWDTVELFIKNGSAQEERDVKVGSYVEICFY